MPQQKKLLVQEYLETKSLAQLKEEHGIDYSFGNNTYKFSLNYNQIDAKEDDALANQCRGLILSIDDIINKTTALLDIDLFPIGKTSILAYPMDRFFNYGQSAAAKIDWGSAVFEEKVDGTLIIVYFDAYKGSWCVATRKVPDGDIPINDFGLTFRELFIEAIKFKYNMSFEEFMMFFNKKWTYCYELTSPINRIVVKYDNYNITQLSSRNNRTFEEWPSFEIKRYKFSDMNQLINFVNEQDPLKHEGIIVRDQYLNRIKVKNASYVAMNKIRDNCASSRRNRLSLVLNKKVSNVVKFLPSNISSDLNLIQLQYINMLTEMFFCYMYCLKKSKGDQKQFANILLEEIEESWPAPIFAMYHNSVDSVEEYIMKKSDNGKFPKNLLDNILRRIEKNRGGEYFKNLMEGLNEN